MKSSLAKQSPQISPWLKMRARQEMQTGGSRRLAMRPSTGRKTPCLHRSPKGAGEIPRPSSPSPIVMAPIIRRNGFRLKARSLARR